MIVELESRGSGMGQTGKGSKVICVCVCFLNRKPSSGRATMGRQAGRQASSAWVPPALDRLLSVNPGPSNPRE